MYILYSLKVKTNVPGRWWRNHWWQLSWHWLSRNRCKSNLTSGRSTAMAHKGGNMLTLQPTALISKYQIILYKIVKKNLPMLHADFAPGVKYFKAIFYNIWLPILLHTIANWKNAR